MCAAPSFQTSVHSCDCCFLGWDWSSCTNREFGSIFQLNQLLMLLYYKTIIFDLHLLFPFQKRWESIPILVSAAVLPNKHNQWVLQQNVKPCCCSFFNRSMIRLPVLQDVPTCVGMVTSVPPESLESAFLWKVGQLLFNIFCVFTRFSFY